MLMTSFQSEFLILPPARSAPPRVFRNTELNPCQYNQMLAEMQRLRGSVYLRDGAIQEHELTPDGRHELAVDEHSWHILLLDDAGRVSGCLRYLEENKASRFDQLWIRQSALTNCPIWGEKFRRAVQLEMERAARKQMSFGEVGGWAVAQERRGTVDPLRMVLVTCGLFRLLGGCVGLATATVRHGSASILRRIGLTPLTVNGLSLPPYYDPHYQCQMEALRFDSDFPNLKYAKAIEELSDMMELMPVVCCEDRAPVWGGRLRDTDLLVSKPAALRSLQPVVVQ